MVSGGKCGIFSCCFQKPDGTERPTKWEDLQGFWDMVKLQIDDLDELFAEIAFMRQNEWKDIPIRVQVIFHSAWFSCPSAECL